jgi:hypothetical protein
MFFKFGYSSFKIISKIYLEAYRGCHLACKSDILRATEVWGSYGHNKEAALRKRQR